MQNRSGNLARTPGTAPEIKLGPRSHLLSVMQNRSGNPARTAGTATEIELGSRSHLVPARRNCSDKQRGLPVLHLKLNWDHGPTLFSNFYHDLNSEYVIFIHVYSASG